MFEKEQLLIAEKIKEYCAANDIQLAELKWTPIPFSGEWGTSTSFFQTAANEVRAGKGKKVPVPQRAQEIAEQVKGRIGSVDGVSHFEAVKGYLNVYYTNFIWKWRRSLRKKQAAWPQLYDLGDALELDSLTEMTAHLVHLFGDFPSLADYLDGYAVVGDTLATLTRPTRIISAADDPIIPAEDLARLARPASLEITRTDFGGHCGYYEGGRGSTWIEREVYATLSEK